MKTKGAEIRIPKDRRIVKAERVNEPTMVTVVEHRYFKKEWGL